jgi:GNAT superfamily N-acetyltransferase
MCDEWMPLIKLPLTPEQFRQLPRNAAYKYEYVDDQAYLSPRARHYHAMLDLRPLEVEGGIMVQRLELQDLDRLVDVFAEAFRGVQPYGSLDDATRREAARQALERTRGGGDGPWVPQASFLALGAESSTPMGAILITLLPGGDPCDGTSYYWDEPPPADCIERRLGRPHLTWIFVSPLHAGQGVGTALLAGSVRELLHMGYTELASTFLAGNDSSMLWHWRNGFRLLAYPLSLRQLRQRRRDRQR